MMKSKLNFFNFCDKNVILNLVFLFRKSWAFRSLMNTMASENAPSSSSTPASANCELPPSGDTVWVFIVTSFSPDQRNLKIIFYLIVLVYRACFYGSNVELLVTRVAASDSFILFFRGRKNNNENSEPIRIYTGLKYSCVLPIPIEPVV